jgi:hypothetical protein
MSFTDWFFTWPVIVFGILVVCAARIVFDHLVARDNRRQSDEIR